ncbi:unnamed protein product [Victoria cruziana]
MASNLFVGAATKEKARLQLCKYMFHVNMALPSDGVSGLSPQRSALFPFLFLLIVFFPSASKLLTLKEQEIGIVFRDEPWKEAFSEDETAEEASPLGRLNS